MEFILDSSCVQLFVASRSAVKEGTLSHLLHLIASSIEKSNLIAFMNVGCKQSFVDVVLT